jgi:hypothetical protein
MVTHITIHPRFDKIHSHGACKSPRSRAANRSARCGRKLDSYTTHLSKRTAFNTEVDIQTKGLDLVQPTSALAASLSDREYNRELKRIYGKAWQKVKAGHPMYSF